MLSHTLSPGICAVKPKNYKERESQDFEIPDDTMHPVNLDSDDKGRRIAVYTHKSIDKCTIQIKPELSFNEASLLEIKLRGGDILLFGCFYRSPTATEYSDHNNVNLNNLLRTIYNKK